jgi:hypothetical protein
VLQTACLEVRVLPWWPRRRIHTDDVRETTPDLTGVDDLTGLVVMLGLWLAVIIAAPLVALVLAALFLSVEVPLLVAIALLLVVLRFAGVIPWTVLTVDAVTGAETRSRHRSILRAVRRVREVNHDRRVQVRWSWR